MIWSWKSHGILLCSRCTNLMFAVVVLFCFCFCLFFGVGSQKMGVSHCVKMQFFMSEFAILNCHEIIKNYVKFLTKVDSKGTIGT